MDGRRGSIGSIAMTLVVVLAVVVTCGFFALTLLLNQPLDPGTATQPKLRPGHAFEVFEPTREPRTYVGPGFLPTVENPTADKPQSKLWYAGGTWWALLVSSADDLVHIHELTTTHEWVDTGTVVDRRPGSTGDALWNDRTRQLVVASRARHSSARVTRFTYHPGERSWSRDNGFPVTVRTGGGSESVSVDQDSTGRLWLTYTRAEQVWVAHSDRAGTSWTPGFSPAVSDPYVSRDDISTLVAFDAGPGVEGGDSIGVLWSDQDSEAFRFAIHRDGEADSAWRVETAVAGPDVADDHLNVKTTPGRGGDRVLAAVKTSRIDRDGRDATLVGVLDRRPPAAPGEAAQWSMTPAGTVTDDHTRPMILVDPENRTVWFFATAYGRGKGDAYAKSSPLSRLRFPDGLGRPFLDHGTRVHSVTGTKQPVSNKTGLLVLAYSHGQHTYVHAEAAPSPAGALR